MICRLQRLKATVAAPRRAVYSITGAYMRVILRSPAFLVVHQTSSNGTGLYPCANRHSRVSLAAPKRPILLFPRPGLMLRMLPQLIDKTRFGGIAAGFKDTTKTVAHRLLYRRCLESEQSVCSRMFLSIHHHSGFLICKSLPSIPGTSKIPLDGGQQSHLSPTSGAVTAEPSLTPEESERCGFNTPLML